MWFHLHLVAADAMVSLGDGMTPRPTPCHHDRPADGRPCPWPNCANGHASHVLGRGDAMRVRAYAGGSSWTWARPDDLMMERL